MENTVKHKITRLTNCKWKYKLVRSIEEDRISYGYSDLYGPIILSILTIITFLFFL